MLQAIAAELLPLGLSGAELSGLEEGWAALADLPADPARYGRSRGTVLFGLSARLLGVEPDSRLAEAGEGWALVDQLARTGEGGREPDLRAIGIESCRERE